MFRAKPSMNVIVVQLLVDLSRSASGRKWILDPGSWKACDSVIKFSSDDNVTASIDHFSHS
jgi:hypothetical protein